MSFIFGLIGAAISIIGAFAIIIITRKLGVNSSSFDMFIVVTSPLVGIIGGWLLYNFYEQEQESKRIEVELEQDRIRYEQERNK
jgi:hypothetical protein